MAYVTLYGGVAGGQSVRSLVSCCETRVSSRQVALTRVTTFKLSQSNLSIFAGSDPANAGLMNPRCASGVTAASTGTNVTCRLSSRFVTVQMQSSSPGVLSLCEVQARGAPCLCC